MGEGMNEAENLLMEIADKLDAQAERGTGYDYGDMDAETAWHSAITAMSTAIKDAIDAHRRIGKGKVT
jgi:hypothetical protein